MFCRATIAIVFACAAANGQTGLAPIVGEPLPRWMPGVLDIHQISTGRGNAALLVLPDSTTILIDAGDAGNAIPSATQYPDTSRTAGDWISRYIARHAPASAPLDYAIVTHLHVDHIGAVTDRSPSTLDGAFRLTGLSHVGATIGVRTLIDRGWPLYDYPQPVADPATTNYRQFAEWLRARGSRVERFVPGSRSQIALTRNARAYPTFHVRNLIANGEVWTGRGDSTRQTFPTLTGLARPDWPTENMCSVGLLVAYGRFRYLTSGDVPGGADARRGGWGDVERSIAGSAGRVDVHVANHHGGDGAGTAEFLTQVDSRITVVPAWAHIHPGRNALARIAARSGERLVFTTDFRDSLPGMRRAGDSVFAGPPGHVVVRVAPGGAQYWVAVVDNRDERGVVRAVRGPFASTGTTLGEPAR